MRFQPLLVALAALAALAAAWAEITATQKVSPPPATFVAAPAPAPANDAFATAQAAFGRSWAIAADNRGATREAGEPRISGLPGGKSLWYEWVAPVSRRYHLSAWSSSSEVNTMLGVYTIAAAETSAAGTEKGGAAAAPAFSTLNEITTATRFKQRSASLSDAAVSFNAIGGTTYYIAVDSQTTAAGTFVLSLIDSEWEFLGLGGGFVTPAVGSDGTIYTAESTGFLYAINPDGTQKWRFAMDGATVLGGPALAADGTVYIGDDANTLYAIDAGTGVERWRYEMAGEILSSPAVGADGTVYIRCEDGRLYAIAPGGVKKWEAALPASAVSLASPVVAADGTIYCGAADGRLYAIGPDGVRRWEFNSGGAIYGAPALDAEGVIYFGSAAKKFFAVSPTGVQLWTVNVPQEIGGSPAIGMDGTIYFGGGDGHLYAVSPTGAMLWNYETGAGIILGAPSVAADGTIYIGSDDSLVHAVNPDGTRQRVFATGDHITASPLLHHGMLYIPSLDYRLYAVAVGQVAASSDWPMDRQNAARTGRSGGSGLEITVPPRSQTALLGTVAAFTVGATGPHPLTYQWYFNGRPIAGATGESYAVEGVTRASAGQYTVRVADKTISLLSSPAALTVDIAAGNDARLASLTTRAIIGTGADVLIPGIVIAGSSPKQIVIRAIGPGLAEYGVIGALARPQLRLLRGDIEVAQNTGWDAQGNGAAVAAAFEQVAAFPFAPGSADCALLVTLAPGSYTAQVSGLGNSTGVALVEVYEVGATPSRITSLTSRAHVGTGSDALISGLNVAGSGAKQFLIRAIGPGIAEFGVIGALVRPQLEVFSGSVRIASNTGWTTAANAPQVAAATSAVGAFDLAPGSADSALLVTLQPGHYTLQISGATDTTGISLLEVYEVP